MAAPLAFAGVTALANVLVKVVEWIVSKFAARFTVRMATSLGWIAFYIALLVGLGATFTAIISGISASLPGDLAAGLGMVKPANFEACVAAIYSAKIAMWVFHHKRQIIEWEQLRPSI